MVENFSVAPVSKHSALLSPDGEGRTLVTAPTREMEALESGYLQVLIQREIWDLTFWPGIDLRAGNKRKAAPF